MNLELKANLKNTLYGLSFYFWKRSLSLNWHFEGIAQKWSSSSTLSPPLSRQLLISSGPLLLTVNLGMVLGFSAVLLPQLQSEAHPIPEEDLSWIASIAALPLAFGCILGGALMERVGRKGAHQLIAVLLAGAWLVVGAARSTGALLAGRFVAGLGGGMLGPVTSVYISETCPSRQRGWLLAAVSSAVALGLLLAHALGTFLPWRAAAALSALPPTAALALLALVPESPSWIAVRGPAEPLAQRAFFWCHGLNDASKTAYAAVAQRCGVAPAPRGGLRAPEFWKPLAIISVFIAANQLSGVNAVTFYTVDVMGAVLGGHVNSFAAMLTVDAIRFACSVLACVAMNGCRRRTLALISGTGTSLSLFALSAHVFAAKCWPGAAALPALPLTAVLSYIAFITMGFVPLPWAMMGELFPTDRRFIGSAISSFVAFAAFFVVVKTYPAMLALVGADGTFFAYGLVALLGTVFVFVFLPETRNKPLHEIEEMFKK